MEKRINEIFMKIPLFEEANSSMNDLKYLRAP
jgi:hypothetical protein